MSVNEYVPMGTGIGGRVYIIMGFISLDLIFSGFPSLGKCELTPGEFNKTTYMDGIFRQHTLNTEGCVIPNLFYSDQKKNNHTHFPDDIEVCANSENRLLNNSQTHIWVVHSNLHYYNATNDEHFRCCYKPFHLAINVDDEGNKSTIQYEDCVLFNDTLAVCHEFVRVFCYYNTRIIYNQLFAFLMDKPQVRANNGSNSLEDHAFPAQTETHVDELPLNESYNVILLGISLISRLDFHKTMPKTIDVLKDKDTVEFFGYNRYASAKLDNIIPALIGKNTQELNDKCKLHGENRRRHSKDCLFIWDHFKRNGYNTALVEDTTESSISSYFTNSRPTDYYFNPFIMESEQDDIKLKQPAFCTGDKYTYKIMLDYMDQMLKNLKTSKLFGLFWQSSLSNLGFSYPIIIDSDYEMFLRNLNENGHLNRTVLVIFSDRGSSYGNSQEYYLEERLPLLKLVLPSSFRHNYKIAYNNLRKNSERLVTTFDIHATLMDLVNLDVIRDEEILIKSEIDYSSSRAISLFVPIPDKRTCRTAHLSDYECTCYKEEGLRNLSGLTAEYVSKLVVPEINKIISPYPQCRRLTLRRLVKMSKYTATYVKEHRWMEYLVRVQAFPEGVFDAVVRFDKTWQFVAPINRLDYDGLRSYCVDDPFVKIYCICHPKPIMERIIPLPLLTSKEIR